MAEAAESCKVVVAPTLELVVVGLALELEEVVVETSYWEAEVGLI